ncbi:MAG TPA: thiamine-phosphate kinase [Planktothrix sp.]|jgi:thiamine-monophosphate kinase
MSSANTDVLTNEQRLVETIKGWADNSYIGDDCAVLPGGLLVTTDSLVEGTHFVTGWTSYRDLGWKACAVNLSDIAAMAGRPRYVLASLTVPSSIREGDFREFYESFVGCARAYRAQVVGGDLTTGPSFVIAVTVLGHVHENGCLARTGASAGDVVVVTGDFGASRAGLWLLQNGCDTPTRKRFAHCLGRHEHPLPRVCESWALVRKTSSRGALMDASDGLADALVQISRKSKVGMVIDLDAIPVHDETRSVAKLACASLDDWVLYGGEDYELVATLPAAVWQQWQGEPDNPYKKIGLVTSSREIELKRAEGGGPALDMSKSFQQIKFD